MNMPKIRFSKELITRNFGLKALSVFMAMFLWYSVNFTGSSEVAVEIPIKFEGIPKKYELLWESNKTVTVWLTGQRRVVRGVLPDMVSAVVDLSHSKAGESFHQLNFGDLKLPPYVTPRKISPNVIRVHLEPLITRDLNVRPVLKGNPAEGFEVVSVGVIPGTIKVEGLRRFLKDEKDISTKPVDITGITGDVKKEAGLDLNGMNYQLDIDAVTVTVNVKEIQNMTGKKTKKKAKGKK